MRTSILFVTLLAFSATLAAAPVAMPAAGLVPSGPRIGRGSLHMTSDSTGFDPESLFKACMPPSSLGNDICLKVCCCGIGNLPAPVRSANRSGPGRERLTLRDKVATFFRTNPPHELALSLAYTVAVGGLIYLAARNPRRH